MHKSICPSDDEKQEMTRCPAFWEIWQNLTSGTFYYCFECLNACPYGVRVNDVLRYSMYSENYGQEKEAMRLYARVPEANRAGPCVGCSAPCEASCPFDLPIRDKLVRADRLLRWA